MTKAVELAWVAKVQFLQTHSDVCADDVKIALSLGPYGATLSPAQEFDGFYQPPYGPKGYTAKGENRTAFTAEETRGEGEAVEALTHFHLERLGVFKSNHEIWRKIDCVGFETVPLVKEVKAIRSAMGSLANASGQEKPWWISTVWPNGTYPQEVVPGGRRLGALDVLHAVLASGTSSFPAPTGIGINCTQMRHLGQLANEYGQALDDGGNSAARRPWLVLYPNGGEQYDTTTQAWTKPAHEEETKENWAKSLVSIAHREGAKGIWAGIVLGGCCKTEPRDIRALSRALENQ